MGTNFAFFLHPALLFPQREYYHDVGVSKKSGLAVGVFFMA